MSRMLAKDILQDVRRALNELGANAEYWTDSELLSYINDGALATAIAKPDVSVKNTEITLVTGPKQTLPEDGMRLLDVIRGGNGRAVTYVDRATLDRVDPNWYARPNSGEPVHFMHDSRDPTVFYLYRDDGDYACYSITVLLSNDDSLNVSFVLVDNERWVTENHDFGVTAGLIMDFETTDYRPDQITFDVNLLSGDDTSDMTALVYDSEDNVIGSETVNGIGAGHSFDIELDFTGAGDMHRLVFQYNDYLEFEVSNVSACGYGLESPMLLDGGEV